MEARAGVREIRNPKSEIRKKSEIRGPKSEWGWASSVTLAC